MAVGAHNTIYVQTHLAGSTMFALYGKRQHLLYCLCSGASGRLYRVRPTCPDGTVLQVRRAWQGTVLGIAVDLSALPYLLHLLPEPTPIGRLWSVVSSRPRPFWSGKSSEQRSSVFSDGERGSESDCGSTMARPFGHTSDQISWPEVPVGDWIVVLACHRVSGPIQACAVATPPVEPSFVGKRVHWGSWIYEPDILKATFTVSQEIPAHNHITNLRITRS